MTEPSHQLQNNTSPAITHWFSLDQTSEPLLPGNNEERNGAIKGVGPSPVMTKEPIAYTTVSFPYIEPPYPPNPGSFTPGILIWRVATQLVYGR